MLRVKSLIFYPIKSCGGIEVESSSIDERGLENDRRLMIVDSDGSSITQREAPKLAVIAPLFVEKDVLELNAPGMPSLRLHLAPAGETVTAKVWQQPYQAVDQGDEVAQWLSSYLGSPARLVRIGEAFTRVVPFSTDKTAHVSFADHFPVVITTQEALDHLNSKLEHPVQMSRYRPNIVIEGCPVFEEYDWSYVEIGPVLFEITRVCDRCSITTVDQETAKSSCESLTMLATFKSAKNSKPVFGLHASPLRLGSISIKSPVKAGTNATGIQSLQN